MKERSGVNVRIDELYDLAEQRRKRIDELFNLVEERSDDTNDRLREIMSDLAEQKLMAERIERIEKLVCNP